MKKLVMSALLLALAQGAMGCIFVSGDDDDGPSGTASVSYSWTVLDGNAVAPCPDGATTAALNAQLAGDSSPYVDLYDCADLAGESLDLPAGDYTIWVDLTDTNGDFLFAQSEAASVSLSDGENVQADFDIDGYNGFWDVSWTIEDNVGEVGCAGVANDGVSVLSTIAGAGEGIDDVFDCTDGEDPAIATTPALPIGSYVVVLSILEPGSNLAIGESAELQPRIEYGNEFVDLGSVPIVLF